MLQQYQDSEIRTAERNQVFTSLQGGTTYTTTIRRQTTVPMSQAPFGGVGSSYRAPRQAQRTHQPKRERIVETRVRPPRALSERERVRTIRPLVIPPVPLQPPVQKKSPPPKPEKESSLLIVEQ